MAQRVSNDIETMRTVGVKMADAIGIKNIGDADAMQLAVASTKWLELFGIGDHIDKLNFDPASYSQMVIGEGALGVDSQVNFDARKVQDGIMVRGSITNSREDLLVRQISLYTTFAEDGGLSDTKCRMVLNTPRGPRYVTILHSVGLKMQARVTNEYDAVVADVPKQLENMSALTILSFPQFLEQVAKEVI